MTVVSAGTHRSAATFFPRSFYDDFPSLGRIWVAIDGPFDEHLVRTAAVAWLVNAVPHLVYHLRHLGTCDTFDQIGNVVSLGTLALTRRPATSAGFEDRHLRLGPEVRREVARCAQQVLVLFRGERGEG